MILDVVVSFIMLCSILDMLIAQSAFMSAIKKKKYFVIFVILNHNTALVGEKKLKHFKVI